MRNLIGILFVGVLACGPSTGTVGSGTGGSTGGTTGGSTPTSCSIGGQDYPAGAANPADGCQICQPTVIATDWSSKSCPASQVCFEGSCVSSSDSVDGGDAGEGDAGIDGGGDAGGGDGGSHCDVDGTKYNGGMINPTNPCEECSPADSTTAWSNTADGTACLTDEVCTNGSCQAGCFVAGVFQVSTEPNPIDSCQICEPATSTSSWTAITGPAPVGGSCDAGQVCNAGACIAGCYIASAFVAPGALDPTSACESCQPLASGSSWSPFTGPAPDGGCAPGDVCDNGNCCAPNCAGRCPYAADDCGGQCPVPAGAYPGCTADAGVEGCCDPTGVCQAGDTLHACTVGGGCQDCTATANSCNAGPGGYSCCTPGQGCGTSCGDVRLLDQCGNVCPFNCPTTNCCDAHLDCQPGTNSLACGTGGTLNSCVACSGVSCTIAQACGTCLDGAVQPQACPACMVATESCVSGEWKTTACSACPQGIPCISNKCGD